MGEEKNSAFQIIRRAETETGNSGCAGRNPGNVWCWMNRQLCWIPLQRKEVINIVKELNQKEGMTIILITHHTDEVVDADRIILMKDGKIIGDDTPKKIFADHSLLKSAKMDIPPVVELSMRTEKAKHRIG